MILNEQITFIETLTALYHDTDTDFATDTLTNTSIIGTGSSAYIKLTGGTGGNQAKHPTAGSQSGSGGAWYDDYNVQGVTRTYDSSDSTFSQCTNGGWSKKINHNGYGFYLFDAKFWGVVIMGGSVVIMFFLPWLDHSPVKSIRYRPQFHKYIYGIFVVCFVILGYLGIQPPSPVFEKISQICTIYYLGFFLGMPFWSKLGTFKPVPTRVTFKSH